MPHASALRVQEENKQSRPELKDVFSFAIFFSKVVATFLSAVAFIELFMMASHFKVLFGGEKSRFRINERLHPLKRKSRNLYAISLSLWISHALHHIHCISATMWNFLY